MFVKDRFHFFLSLPSRESIINLFLHILVDKKELIDHYSYFYLKKI